MAHAHRYDRLGLFRRMPCAVQRVPSHVVQPRWPLRRSLKAERLRPCLRHTPAVSVNTCNRPQSVPGFRGPAAPHTPGCAHAAGLRGEAGEGTWVQSSHCVGSGSDRTCISVAAMSCRWSLQLPVLNSMGRCRGVAGASARVCFLCFLAECDGSCKPARPPAHPPARLPACLWLVAHVRQAACLHGGVTELTQPDSRPCHCDPVVKPNNQLTF